MTVDAAVAVAEMDSVLSDCTSKQSEMTRVTTTGSDQEFARIAALLRAAIERWAPIGTSYRRDADAALKVPMYLKVQTLLGTLRALREDYNAGRLKSFAELVHGDVFEDYLAMAEHLLEKHYKDAAAVIAGSTLEAHLRQLCAKSAVIITKPNGEPKVASALNDDLKAANVYPTGEHKQVTAWIDLRNNAAHGHYANVAEERVSYMITGVRDFIVRHPA